MYKPALEITPTVALPPARLFTLQVTAVLVEPVTAALKDRVAAGATAAVAGVTLTVTGLAAVIRNLTAVLVVPPSPVLVTVMGICLPACAAVAVPVAFSPVGESSVVARATPPKFTTELEPKFDPLSWMVKAPAGVEVGETLQSCTGGWVIVSVTAPNFAGSAVLVARTLTALLVGTVVGAW